MPIYRTRRRRNQASLTDGFPLEAVEPPLELAVPCFAALALIAI